MGNTTPSERTGTQPRRLHAYCDETERNTPGDAPGSELALRQAALLVNFKGDRLKIDEIEQLERYQALNPAVPLRRKIAWIPQHGSFESANDIIWNVQGAQQFEMKTSGAKYKSIASAIKDAVFAARNNPNGAAVKDRFLVDIKNVRLSHKLRHQLELYNVRNPSNTIRELWIMGAGQLEQIRLV